MKIQVGQVVTYRGTSHVVSGVKREKRGRVRIIATATAEQINAWKTIDAAKGDEFHFVPGLTVNASELS